MSHYQNKKWLVAFCEPLLQAIVNFIFQKCCQLVMKIMFMIRFQKMTKVLHVTPSGTDIGYIMTSNISCINNIIKRYCAPYISLSHLLGGELHLHTISQSNFSSELNIVGLTPLDAGTYKCVVGEFQKTTTVLVNGES